MWSDREGKESEKRWGKRKYVKPLVKKKQRRRQKKGRTQVKWIQTRDKNLRGWVVRATLPSALNVINASSVGKLVQPVTASRLILNHKGRVDPMKDECHYQIKH